MNFHRAASLGLGAVLVLASLAVQGHAPPGATPPRPPARAAARTPCG
jgi:hypothetical protein